MKNQLIEASHDTDVVRIIYALHVPKNKFCLHDHAQVIPVYSQFEDRAVMKPKESEVKCGRDMKFR